MRLADEAQRLVEKNGITQPEENWLSS